MPRKRDGADHFKAERRKIQASGILDALIEYAEGRRDMSTRQVSAALGLLKKVLPDLSTHALGAEAEGRSARKSVPGAGKKPIEIRIVDPQG